MASRNQLIIAYQGDGAYTSTKDSNNVITVTSTFGVISTINPDGSVSSVDTTNGSAAITTVSTTAADGSVSFTAPNGYVIVIDTKNGVSVKNTDGTRAGTTVSSVWQLASVIRDNAATLNTLINKY